MMKSVTKWVKVAREPTPIRIERGPVGSLPFAGHILSKKGDYYELSDEEVYYLASIDFNFDKPVVVRRNEHEVSNTLSRQMYTRPILEHAQKVSRCNKPLEVQTLDPKKKTEYIRCDDFCKRIKEENEGYFADRLPVNCLNLEGATGMQKPAFLNHERFQLLQECRMFIRPIHGKVTMEGRRPVDVESSTGFDLMGTRLTYSKPHVDILGGTVATNLDGEKIWMVSEPLTKKPKRSLSDMEAISCQKLQYLFLFSPVIRYLCQEGWPSYMLRFLLQPAL